MPLAAPPPSVGAPDRAEPTDAAGRRTRPLLRTMVGAVCALLALALWQSRDRGAAPLTAADVDRAVQRGVDKAKQDERNTPPEAATAFRTIGPSLVTVTTAGGGAGTAASGAGTESGLGAGVVINAQGAILTAFHVVDGANVIHVQFADGTKATARVASSQPENDIAVLSADQLPQVIVPAVLAGPPGSGETVFAVGNPFGLIDSLTAGVVSANNRRIQTDRGRDLSGLIQFDAAVNPGNSGGPLLDRNGHVVGIVTALANPSKQAYFVGIGFAIPIATAGGAAGGPQQ